MFASMVAQCGDVVFLCGIYMYMFATVMCLAMLRCSYVLCVMCYVCLWSYDYVCECYVWNVCVEPTPCCCDLSVLIVALCIVVFLLI